MSLLDKLSDYAFDREGKQPNKVPNNKLDLLSRESYSGYVPKRRCYINNVPENSLDKIVFYNDITPEIPLVKISTLQKTFPGFTMYEPIRYNNCGAFPLPPNNFRQIMVMVSDPGCLYCIPLNIPENIYVKSYLWWRGQYSKIYPISDNSVTYEKPDLKLDSYKVYPSEGKCTVAPKVYIF